MKILIVKPSSFGDIIQANPTLTALKKIYPQSTISWLVFDCWADILDLFPDVDQKIIWKRKGGLPEYFRVMHQLRSEKFDLLIDLQSLARTAILSRFSGAKQKIGCPGMKEFSWLLVKEPYPESRKMNAALRSLETVRFLSGQKMQPEFRLAVPQKDDQEAAALLQAQGITASDTVIGLIPFVRGKAKQWPVEYFEKLVDMIGEKYPSMKYVVLGAAGDAGKINHPQIVDLCGRTTVRTLAGVMCRCGLVVGGDTGPTHLAAALQVPVAVIFGGSDIVETAPVTKKAVLLSRYLPCSPCRGRMKCKDQPCLTGITPAEVLAAITYYLDRENNRA